MLRAACSLCTAILFLAVPLRAELVWEKAIQNFHRLPSDGPLETKFAFRNGGTSAQLGKDTSAPGENGEISVRFTFGDRKGPNRKIITVITDDKPEPTELSLQVWIDEPMTIAPDFPADQPRSYTIYARIK